MVKHALAALALSAVVVGCGSAPADSSLQTVSHLDVKRYMGTWYDVADFPQDFQEDCHCTKARYDLLPWGDVLVRNSCLQGGTDGRPIAIVGRAFLPDPDEPGKLKVSFFNPTGSDYWVIELGEDYQYAVVSDPNLDTLWILSRTPTMDAALLSGIKTRLEQKGFDLTRLVEVQHEGCPDL